MARKTKRRGLGTPRSQREESAAFMLRRAEQAQKRARSTESCRVALDHLIDARVAYEKSLVAGRVGAQGGRKSNRLYAATDKIGKRIDDDLYQFTHGPCVRNTAYDLKGAPSRRTRKARR